jgi:outer membrane protein TolC
MVLYQDRQIKLEQAFLDLQNKKAKMEIFLWENGFFPLELDSTVQPYPFESVPEFQSTNLNSLNMDTLIDNHPVIIRNKYQIDLTDIEFRLKRESLKPTVQLKYNALMINDFENGFDAYSTDNYTWGAKVSYPIFIRKERGAVELSRIKLQEQDLKLKDSRVKVAYQIQSAFNTYLSMQKQVKIYSETVKNYANLLQAEEQLFSMGESSMFMVNTRDQYLLDVQIKYVDILYQQYEALVDYNYQIFAY